MIDLFFKIEFVIIFISILIGLWLIRKRSYNLFPIVVLLTLDLTYETIRQLLNANSSFSFLNLTSHVYYVVNLGIVVWFVLSNLNFPFFKNIIRITYLGFVVFAVINLIFIQHYNEDPSYSSLVSSMLILFFNLILFVDLLDSPKKIKLHFSTPFIFCIGFLLFNIFGFIFFLLWPITKSNGVVLFNITMPVLWASIFIYYLVMLSGILMEAFKKYKLELFA